MRCNLIACALPIACSLVRGKVEGRFGGDWVTLLPSRVVPGEEPA